MLPLLLLACKPPATPAPPVPAAEPVSLTVVGMNDFHGALYEYPQSNDPNRAHGGLAILSGAVAALRADDPDLVLLDGGDVFQGTWAVNQTKGRGAVEALNLLGVDAGAIGNHEFDYGGDGDKRGALKDAAKLANWAWLTANVYEGDARWQPEGIAPWAMIEKKGVRVAVIGLTTTETPQTTLLRNVDDLSFTDPVEAVQALLPEIEAREPHAIAIVGHLTGKCEPKGYFEVGEPCVPDGEIGRLLTELPPGTIDVMVLGHAHTLLAQRIGDTFVLEARAKGDVLNRLDLVIGPDGVDADASTLHEPWGLTHARIDPGCGGGEYPLAPLDVGGRTVTPDARAVELIARLEAEAGSLCDVIGCAGRALGRDRQAQSDVGDLVADAMKAAFPAADLAITNSGGLRADVPAGELRREHVQAVMPFDNELLLVEMSGAQVERMLRVGSSGAHGVLQLAGGGYAFDPARETGDDLDGDGAVANWERNRLCGGTVGGAPIDPARTYKVVTTDFLYEGGDHMGAAFAGVPIAETGPLLRDAIFRFVEHAHADGGSCVAQAPSEVRITTGACP